MEISLDAWVGVQRHGQDLADRLAHGLSDLLQLQVQPPQLPWSPPALPLPHKLVPFDIDLPVVGGSVGDLPAVAAASFVEIGDRLGQAGSELGASVGGAVQGLARRIPVPFRSEGARCRKWEATTPPPPAAVDEGEVVGLAVERATESGIALERVGDRDALEAAAVAAAAATGSAAAASASRVGDAGGADGLDEEDDGLECETETLGNFKKAKGTVNVSAAYNTRHHTIDSSAVARGDIWRVETSRGDSTYGNGNAPLFLIQLGPLLFVRDSTLLLPVHLSKQHLLWYGYDRKNGVHSLCPAIWSKHRKWLLMSMMCLNPVACSFMDVQFPNGQLTYVAGEGITATGFFPLFGGLLQAHGKCPGETKLSFSFKSKRGTRFTPTFKWPDNSLSFGIAQAVAWKKSGLMVRPSIQVSVFPLMNNLIHETTCTSVCPTFGGSDPGIRAEFVHSLKEELNVMCGFSCSRHPSAFTSLSLGRSKWNGQVGSSGVVITLETPLDNMGRPSLSVQLNAGVEF